MSRGKTMLVSGGYDHSIRFWDVASGAMVKQIPVLTCLSRNCPTVLGPSECSSLCNLTWPVIDTRVACSIRIRLSTCCGFRLIDGGSLWLGIRGVGCTPMSACSEPMLRLLGILCNLMVTRALSLLWSLAPIKRACTPDAKAKL